MRSVVDKEQTTDRSKAMQNNISFNRTFFPKSAPTTLQRVGAAIGIMMCGAAFASVVFFHL